MNRNTLAFLLYLMFTAATITAVCITKNGWWLILLALISIEIEDGK